MVGSHLSDAFSGWQIVRTDIAPGYMRLDVRDRQAVSETIAAVQPQAVIHLAAATDVDRCERDACWAYDTNAAGTEHVALACRHFDIPLVYVSTAAVFPGDKPCPYVESDPTAPANTYGRSKLAGEDVVTSLLRRFYILRAGWMFGGAALDHKFVGKISRVMHAWRTGSPPVRIVDDKRGSPTFGRDLLEVAKTLLRSDAYGLYHAPNRGTATRLQLAIELRRALGRTDIEIAAVSSNEFNLTAPRGGSEAMSTERLERLGVRVRPWEEALAEYVATSLALSLAQGGASMPLASGA